MSTRILPSALAILTIGAVQQPARNPEGSMKGPVWNLSGSPKSQLIKQLPKDMRSAQKLKAGHEFWQVDIEIEHSSNKDQEVESNSRDIFLQRMTTPIVVYPLSDLFTPMRRALAGLLSSWESFPKYSLRVRPGEKIKVTLIFQVPEGLKESDFELKFLDAPPVGLASTPKN